MKRKGSKVVSGRVSACQMSAHGSYQVSCQSDTCLCGNFSPEQNGFDSQHRSSRWMGTHPPPRRRGVGSVTTGVALLGSGVGRRSAGDTGD